MSSKSKITNPSTLQSFGKSVSDNELALSVVNGNNLEELHQFMYNFRIMASSRRWTSNIKNTILSATTTGPAAAVITRAGSDACFEDRWKALQNWYFPSASLHLHLEKLKSMKKSSKESWYEFNERFKLALDKVNLCLTSGAEAEMAFKDALDIFLEKLPLHVRKEIKMARLNSIDEAVKKANAFLLRPKSNHESTSSGTSSMATMNSKLQGKKSVTKGNEACFSNPALSKSSMTKPSSHTSSTTQFIAANHHNSPSKKKDVTFEEKIFQESVFQFKSKLSES